jgi:hypothetical protein
MTHVLVATHRGQGIRKSDFAWAPDGDIVYLADACDRDRSNIDGGCGCRRSWVGMDSRLATTTAEVAELPLTPAQVEATILAIRRSYLPTVWDAVEAEEIAAVRGLLTFAAKSPVGAVVEVRGERLNVRPLPAVRS